MFICSCFTWCILYTKACTASCSNTIGFLFLIDCIRIAWGLRIAMLPTNHFINVTQPYLDLLLQVLSCTQISILIQHVMLTTGPKIPCLSSILFYNNNRAPFPILRIAWGLWIAMKSECPHQHSISLYYYYRIPPGISQIE